MQIMNEIIDKDFKIQFMLYCFKNNVNNIQYIIYWINYKYLKRKKFSLIRKIKKIRKMIFIKEIEFKY